MPRNCPSGSLEAKARRQFPPDTIGALCALFAKEGIAIQLNWMELPLGLFDERLFGGMAGDEGILHPRSLVSRFAGSPFIELVPERERVPMAIWGGGERETPARLSFKVGARARLRVEMPFAGYLAIIAGELDGGWWNYWLIDALAGVSGRRLAHATVSLPEREALPFEGKPSDSVLIAMATRLPPPKFPWQDRNGRDGVIEVDASELRQACLLLAGLPVTDRRVGILEYAIDA